MLLKKEGKSNHDFWPSCSKNVELQQLPPRTLPTDTILSRKDNFNAVRDLKVYTSLSYDWDALGIRETRPGSKSLWWFKAVYEGDLGSLRSDLVEDRDSQN